MKYTLKNKIEVNILPFKGMWYDIGRIEDYDHVNLNHNKILKKINFLKVMYLSIVTPIYNDQENIKPFINQISQTLKKINLEDYEIILY